MKTIIRLDQKKGKIIRRDFYSAITLIIILTIFGCKGKKQEDFNFSHDILKNIQAQLQEETRIIDFRKEADSTRYLLNGWSYPEKEHTWSSARKSSILFYKYNDMNNLDIYITCKAIPSIKKKKQRIAVLLNDNNIGSFIAEPERFKTFSFTLPASLLKFGENIIQFWFSYRTKPKNIYRNSKDKRNLSVVFKRINFKKNLEYSDDRGLLQRANSSFSFLSRLPKRFEIDVRYQNFNGARSSIELSNINEEIISIDLSTRNKILKKVINLKEQGLYKLSFLTNGKSNSYTIWSEMVINTYQKNEIIDARNTIISKFSKPDILIYVIDALRADHLSCYGYGRNTSPIIDQLAKENSIFMNAYANASWTKPSGATILTGLSPKNHKTMSRDSKLSDELVTLAEMLKESGYYTVAFIGNGNLSHVFGFAQGFDMYKELFGSYPFSRHVQSDKINKSVLEFLRSYIGQKERMPLFALVWTVDPHDPYTPEENVKNMFNIQQYDPIDTYDFELLSDIVRRKVHPTPSQIEYMKTRYDQEIYFNDLSFGKLLDTMKELDIYRDSMIIFTADHGEEFFDHGGVVHGMTLYNEQIKIPLIIKARQIEKGIHYERVQHIDIYPTVLDILGFKKPYNLDGISLLQNLDPKRTLYFEEELDGNDINAVLDKNKKLIYNKTFNRRPPIPYVPVFELYNIEDLEERNNQKFSGFEDYLRLQELFYCRNSKSSLGLQPKKAEIPEDLDKRLRALGYVK